MKVLYSGDLKKRAMRSFVNYITELGEGGGKHLGYNMIISVSKMVNLTQPWWLGGRGVD